MNIKMNNIYKNKFLICNNKKLDSMNKSILSRNINNSYQQRNIISYRNDYLICNKYTNLNKNNRDLKINSSNINLKKNFFPGIGSPIDFLKNIDNDSKLKNINILNSRCKRNNTKKNIHINRIHSNISNKICTQKNDKQIWNQITKRKCL